MNGGHLCDDSGVTVEIPAERRFTPLARLTVADAAARAGMNVLEADALAVATGEACLALMRAAPEGAVIRVDVRRRVRGVDIAAAIPGTEPPVRLSADRTAT